MWTRFRKLIAAPVFPEDEEKTRIARLLNTILLVIVILVTCFSIFALAVTPDIARIFVELFILILAIGMLALMRRGHVQLTGIILTSAVWLAVSYGTYLSGGFRGSNMASYFGIIFIAGLLLGNWAALTFGLLSIGFTGWLLFAESQQVLSPPGDYVTLTTFWWEFSMVVLGVVGLLALTMNSLHRALNRARRNERELADKVIEIQKLAREAQEASDFKSQLIARVSHELRTPLGALIGMTEMLHYNEKDSLTDEQKTLTERILANSEYLKTTFSELLEQSQIDVGRLVLKEDPFFPRQILDRVTKSFHGQAAHKGIRIETQVDDRLPDMIWGDAARVEQVLFNLVGNAIKFTETGSVSVAFDVDGDQSWFLRVSDTGIGIPADKLEIIFEPFRQVDETITRRYGGIGLGLSIVKQLTTLMGGDIQANSQLGQGSTFIVRLPLIVDTEDLSSKETETI